MNNTIVAVSTPFGTGAIGVIRLSGRDSIKLSDSVFKGKASLIGTVSHSVHYGCIMHNGEVFDYVVAIVYKAPNSYTGEDTVEISAHGNPLILKKIVELFISLGASYAKPGEFTERAYLNGRMDLIEAEAVNDIINSHTENSLSQAMKHLEGGFSNVINDIHNRILDALALIEAAIDHSDMEEEFYNKEELTKSITSIKNDINALIETSDFGRINAGGLKVAIVGSVNTGKSSLMNMLLEKDRVIVSDIEGTTRDIIEDELNINGITVLLYDTAGFRDTNDFIEAEGIKRTKDIIESADLRIMLFDASREINDSDIAIFEYKE